MTNTYQLKVTLAGAKPPIWRRLLVPGHLGLAGLHRIIQVAMGWEDCHLHSFEVHGTEFGAPDDDGFGGELEMTSEDEHTLESLVAVKDRFLYTYDFGDSWIHGIVVEKVTPAELAAPRCIAGARACPPEDCGGVWGYADLIAALNDKKHARYEELSEWVPEGWSPDQFDLEDADRLVAKHARPRVPPRTPDRKPRTPGKKPRTPSKKPRTPAKKPRTPAKKPRSRGRARG